LSWPPEIEKYLKNSPEFRGWGLPSQARPGVRIAIVIPVLAEKDELFKTLSGLAENNPAMLGKTVVLCVVNNRRAGAASPGDIENNTETLAALKVLAGETGSGATGFELIVVDASSPGRELPDGEGVGTARKIGMDHALSLFDYSQPEEKVLVCLDADTRVQGNYLDAISEHFTKGSPAAAVIDYSHRMPEDEPGAMAAAAYELYLRYYEAGLALAASPYAYHTIGSTMACTAKSYAATGGMNRRMAGEDFYFLQKLAKYGPVGRIFDTTVYPAGRVSNRVPFGTGKKLGDMESEGVTDFPLYHPDSFLVLRDFIRLVQSTAKGGRADGSHLVLEAGRIDPDLRGYLVANDFPEVWDKLKKNSPPGEQLTRHFHNWFDDFRTLKFVHYLRDSNLPNMPMFDAIGQMLTLMGIEAGDLPGRAKGDLAARLELSDLLRLSNNSSIDL